MTPEEHYEKAESLLRWGSRNEKDRELALIHAVMALYTPPVEMRIVVRGEGEDA